MTEQEYCNLTDLQLVRAIKEIVRQMNCIEDPNKTRLKGVEANLRLIETDLQQKIDVTENPFEQPKNQDEVFNALKQCKPES